MNLGDDDFTLFGLPQTQAMDRALLDARRLQLQAQVHPDRFASEGAAAQRMAMQWAVRVNEAYQRLKHPLSRAAYLCALRGAPVDAESNTAMPAAFLVQQMEWREALDEAADAEAVQALDRQIAAREQAMLVRVADLLDVQGDAAGAAAEVRALMFVARVRADVERRLDQLDALS